MTTFWVGNIYLLLTMLCAAGSHILFKALLNEIGPLGFNWNSVYALCFYGRSSRAFLAATLLIAGFLFWIMSLSRLNISYAYPIASASALLVTFFSVLFLEETVSVRMWSGTVLIVAGTILLAPSG